MALCLLPPEQIFLGQPEDSRSQKRSFSVSQALCADSFLIDKLNPLWERDLQVPQSPPGIDLRVSQRNADGVAGLGGSQGTGRKLLPLRWFPRVTSSSQTNGTHTAASLVGPQCSFPFQHCSWEGQSYKLKTGLTIPLMLSFNPKEVKTLSTKQ